MNDKVDKMEQLMKERQKFSAFEESEMMKQVQATHAPDGREVDVKPIIQISEDVLNHAIARSTCDGVCRKREQGEVSEKSAALANFDSLALIIHKISCQLPCKCSRGGGGDADANATTIAILNSLSCYPWQAKVVLTLAAFAVNFGEFWLVAQPWAADRLAKSVAILKQIPDIIAKSASLKSILEAITGLVKGALDLIRCIVEIMELASEYNYSVDTSPMFIATATSHIPCATYWTMRSLVACSSRIAGLRNEDIPSTTEPSELSSLAHKVSNIHGRLNSQLTLCHQYIETNAPSIICRIFLSQFSHSVFRTKKKKKKNNPMDNLKILKELICTKEDSPPLVDGSNRKKASLEVLKRNHVLLFISDLDLSQEEIITLTALYNDSQVKGEVHYEIVWIPIVNKVTWDDSNQKLFEHLQSMMPWYIVSDPMMIEPPVTKYIKEVWNFTKRPIIVALDPQGRLSSSNALHMMWIWGNSAYPFTHEKEEALWMEETWSLKLLVGGIDHSILKWMREGKLMCLYGGEYLDWIQTFTNTTKSVAKASNLELEMVYVGSNNGPNAKERMEKMIATFTARNFSYFLPNVTSIWFFWARLESIRYSKMSQGKNVENDRVLNELENVFSYDNSNQGWAIFSREVVEMVSVKGDLALTSIKEFDKWKENAKRDGLVMALSDYRHKLLREVDERKENAQRDVSVLKINDYENKDLRESDKWKDDVQIDSSMQKINDDHQQKILSCICGCMAEIGNGKFLSWKGDIWHPKCFRRYASNNISSSFQKEEPRRLDSCWVCKKSLQRDSKTNNMHLAYYCASHELDGTIPRCCACELMERRDTKYPLPELSDGRKLCLYCVHTAVMDTDEIQPLYKSIIDFYGGINMKVHQQIPLLLVDRQTLNDKIEKENGHFHLPDAKGLCLYKEEETTGANIYSGRPKYEVTAILVLYGLPRILTGSILAHEMMHAWLRLQGYRNLAPQVEEGLCQVLASMWLGAEYDRSRGRLRDALIYKSQIETDTSLALGDGYRLANQAMLNFGLSKTVEHIRLTGTFPMRY